uniref:Uncharacterized protein n=1 Tax=Plectus sambesii TaxID=2011161 RepID=A0A914WI44_9BILA
MTIEERTWTVGGREGAWFSGSNDRFDRVRALSAWLSSSVRPGDCDGNPSSADWRSPALRLTTTTIAIDRDFSSVANSLYHFCLYAPLGIARRRSSRLGQPVPLVLFSLLHLYYQPTTTMAIGRETVRVRWL